MATSLPLIGCSGSTRTAHLSIVHDLTNLASHLPLIDHLSVVASSIVGEDNASHECSPIVSIQVDIPADEQENTSSSSRTDNNSTAFDSILGLCLNTPKAPLVMLSWNPSPKCPPTVLSFVTVPIATDHI